MVICDCSALLVAKYIISLVRLYRRHVALYLVAPPPFFLRMPHSLGPPPGHPSVLSNIFRRVPHLLFHPITPSKRHVIRAVPKYEPRHTALRPSLVFGMTSCITLYMRASRPYFPKYRRANPQCVQPSRPPVLSHHLLFLSLASPSSSSAVLGLRSSAPPSLSSFIRALSSLFRSRLVAALWPRLFPSGLPMSSILVYIRLVCPVTSVA